MTTLKPSSARTLSSLLAPSAACAATRSVNVAKSSLSDNASASALTPGGKPSTLTSTGKAWSSSRSSVTVTSANAPCAMATLATDSSSP